MLLSRLFILKSTQLYTLLYQLLCIIPAYSKVWYIQKNKAITVFAMALFL